MADSEQSSSSDESQCPDCLEDMMCKSCFEAIRPSDSEGSDSEDADFEAEAQEAQRAEIHHHYQYYDFRQQHNHYYPAPAHPPALPLDAPVYQLLPPNNLAACPPPDFDRYRSQSQSSSESESESDEEKEELMWKEQQKLEKK